MTITEPGRLHILISIPSYTFHYYVALTVCPGGFYACFGSCLSVETACDMTPHCEMSDGFVRDESICEGNWPILPLIA